MFKLRASSTVFFGWQAGTISLVETRKYTSCSQVTTASRPVWIRFTFPCRHGKTLKRISPWLEGLRWVRKHFQIKFLKGFETTLTSTRHSPSRANTEIL